MKHLKRLIRLVIFITAFPVWAFFAVSAVIGDSVVIIADWLNNERTYNPYEMTKDMLEFWKWIWK